MLTDILEYVRPVDFRVDTNAGPFVCSTIMGIVGFESTFLAVCALPILSVLGLSFLIFISFN